MKKMSPGILDRFVLFFFHIIKYVTKKYVSSLVRPSRIKQPYHSVARSEGDIFSLFYKKDARCFIKQTLSA